MMGKTTHNLRRRIRGIASAGLLSSLLLLAWPAAPAAWAEPCSYDSDIVVMIDVSGSIEDDVLGNVMDGVRALLASFASNNPRPRVAIGVFSGVGQILDGANLSNDYAIAGSGPLYTALASLSRINPSGTVVSAGLAAAQAELDAHGVASTQDYIILITDGCTDTDDIDAAIQVRNAAVAKGTEFFAIHVGEFCPESVFLQDQIASGAGYYYEGSTELSGVAAKISGQVWFCYDGNPCTKDWCDADGNCVHAVLDGASCDDGLFCNGTDTCVEAVSYTHLRAHET